MTCLQRTEYLLWKKEGWLDWGECSWETIVLKQDKVYEDLQSSSFTQFILTWIPISSGSRVVMRLLQCSLLGRNTDEYLPRGFSIPTNLLPSSVRLFPYRFSSLGFHHLDDPDFASLLHYLQNTNPANWNYVFLKGKWKIIACRSGIYCSTVSQSNSTHCIISSNLTLLCRFEESAPHCINFSISSSSDLLLVLSSSFSFFNSMDSRSALIRRAVISLIVLYQKRPYVHKWQKILKLHTFFFISFLPIFLDTLLVLPLLIVASIVESSCDLQSTSFVIKSH